MINSHLQINLHLTNWLNENNDIQHDCLYISAHIRYENDSRHVIPYCMGEWISKLNIKENKIDKKINFEQLSKLNISSKELYLWSAPIDIIEEYQFYLNQLLNSEKTLLGQTYFYNCTLPNFGSQCQYSLVYYKSYYLSLDKIIFDYYYYNEYEPTLLTCYIHLDCNRGPSPSCLDWTEICDGNIDCLDNKIDEEYCWLIEISQCNQNEYQCSNGQCIPKDFFRDYPYIPDCLDKSDEYYDTNDIITREPTFNWEDVTCVKHFYQNNLNQYVLSSSCLKHRQVLLSQAIFSIKPKSISNECWSALKCIIQMPIIRIKIYSILCIDKLCDNIIEKTCPDIIYIPAVPILFGHIYLAYEKNKMNYVPNRPSKPTYFCYDNQFIYLPDDNNNVILDNNYTCRFYEDSIYGIGQRNPMWLQTIITPLLTWLTSRKVSIYNNSTYCDRSKMYQCIYSKKCISKSRLFDGVHDCYHHDDEKLGTSNEICLPEQNLNQFKCKNNECVSKSFVGNPELACKDKGAIYDAKIIEMNFDLNRSLFQMICDGISQILANNIKYGNDTDETNCEHWHCNNIYTYCDGFWNCLDGADEINCHSSLLLNCLKNNYICVSSQTKQLICLPIEKINDGNIDCIGAIDEPNICRKNLDYKNSKIFHCQNDSYDTCISSKKICNGINDCKYKEDEQSCKNNYTVSGTFKEGICYYDYESFGSDIIKILCRYFYENIDRRTIYFKLEKNNNFIKSNITYKSSEILTKLSSNENVKSYQKRCHRGLDLQVWLHKEKNLRKYVCLCPPSYYGDICQYQNQRISLTLQFFVTSDSVQIPFIIIISLIDNTNENLIHSYEQFTYLSMKYCKRKFNIYLLYSTKPKDPNKNYLIHIDIYEKFQLNYRGSIIKSINYTFLPVHRLVFQIDIPRTNYIRKICSNFQCNHGKCQTYYNDPLNRTFCQCEKGWYGKSCQYKYNCTCSFNSLCLGLLSNNRSLCICPWNKIGSRCLIHNTICDENNNEEKKCLNNGQCIPLDEYDLLNNKFTCICPKGFTSHRCEIIETKLIISFDKNLTLSSSILIHFIEVKKTDYPIHRTTFKTIPIDLKSIDIYWSLPFHIVFIELLNNNNYYLTILQNLYNESIIIEKNLKSSDRCLNINEIFNETILNYHLIRRIKYYHLPCQNKSLELLCFYDEHQFCLCQIHEQVRMTNCFAFEHNMTMDCFGQNGCENNGQCLQDDEKCPKTSLCICQKCFYGKQCQFNTNGFSLSLDAILGYYIKTNINFFKQSSAVIISLILTLLMGFTGIINGILSLITFKDKKARQSGSGIYLLCSSINTLLIMILFISKYFILIISQINLIKNTLFLNIQCISIDFLLRVCLTIDQWLTSSVAIERVLITIKGTSFNQKKTIQAAKYIIIIIISIIILTNIHDPIHRKLFYEDNDYYEDKRIWCIVKYSSTIQYFNLIMNIFHFIMPFIINLISAIIIIIVNTRQKANIQTQQNYRQILIKQIKKHKNLLIGPSVLVILSIPRLIVSFASGCMQSTNDSWLFLLGYFISLIPPTLTFLLFVLPSTTYKQAFRKAVSRYKKILSRHS